MPVYFFADNIKFTFKKKRQVKKLIKDIVLSEGLLPADINVIFCSDDYLLEINSQYLGKDYLTDIITFNYNRLQNISGDLFISIERVQDNATISRVLFDEELIRVIIHGILHLVGYNDSNEKEENAIREKEDFYLRTYLK